MTRHQGNVALDIGAELWALAAPLLIGLVLGVVVVRTLQRRGLRWTWALLGIPAAYLVWFLAWHLVLVLVFTTATAVYLGARVHGEAIQHGGEEAREKHSLSNRRRR